jgi:hypothetical protein
MASQRLQEELDALAVRLGRSLTIDSTSGELIAYSTQRDDAAGDRARISTILLRHVAPEVQRWQERHVGDGLDPVEVPANPELGMTARICVPLHRDGRVLGYLWVLQSGGAPTREEREVLRRGAAALAGWLAAPTPGARSAAVGREVDRIVRRLFVDGQVDAYPLLAEAVPGVVEGAVRVVAVVATAHGAPRQLRTSEFSTLSNALTPVLRASVGYIGSYVSTSYVLVVMHHRTSTDPLPLLAATDDVVDRCLDGDGEGRFTVGVSDTAPLGLRGATEVRKQALTAAELAALDPALGKHVHWSRLGAYRVLLSAAQSRTDRALAPLDEAGSSSSMLLETLETFLDLGGDIRNVAARLNLHRSSLYYRLDRIATLLDADLSDGLRRLELHLALKSRRVRRRTLR